MRLASATRRVIYDTFTFFCRWPKPSGVNLTVLEIFSAFLTNFAIQTKKILASIEAMRLTSPMVTTKIQIGSMFLPEAQAGGLKLGLSWKF